MKIKKVCEVCKEDFSEYSDYIPSQYNCTTLELYEYMIFSANENILFN